jgi:hypothetical protein
MVDGERAETRPFEDVNLKPVWIGTLERDDPLALSNLRKLEKQAGRDDGTVQSHIDPRYESFLGLPIGDGMNTGMVPGFYLYNLTALGDPTAAAAFNALHDYADSAGQYGEYMLYDDRSALSPVYDEGGLLGDYTARHRPWEGGINLDAFLYYLFGAELDPETGALRLRPHLPNHHDRLVAQEIGIGLSRGRLEISRSEERLELSFEPSSSEAIELDVELPLPDSGGDGEEGMIDGSSSGTIVTLPGGERVMRFPTTRMATGVRRTFSVRLP